MSLFIETSAIAFLLLTVLVGCGSAFMAGRGLALTWQPFTRVALYMLVMGAALRFLHFALFEGTLLNPSYYVTDTALLILASGLGYRLTRTGQMTSRYAWLFRRSSPLSWSER